MDILGYARSAEASLDQVKQADWRYSESLTRHLASFYVKPEASYRHFIKQKKKAGFLPGNEGVQWIERLIELHTSGGAAPLHARS